MTCPHLEQTSALFDGALSADIARAAREHLSTCAPCAAFQRDLLQMRGELHAARTLACPQLEQTSALFDDAIAGVDAIAAREHLAACADCGALHRDLLRLRAELVDARRSADVVAIAPRARSLPLRLSLAFNLLLLLVLIGFGLMQPRRTDTPRDASVFGGLDAGGRAVVHVRPRSEER
jgi:hypothetical protein